MIKKRLALPIALLAVSGNLNSAMPNIPMFDLNEETFKSILQAEITPRDYAWMAALALAGLKICSDGSAKSKACKEQKKFDSIWTNTKRSLGETIAAKNVEILKLKQQVEDLGKRAKSAQSYKEQSNQKDQQIESLTSKLKGLNSQLAKLAEKHAESSKAQPEAN